VAVKLSEKRTETAVFTVKWGEDDVDVCYRVNAVTPALLEEVDKSAQEDNLDVMGALLEPILEWWDVLDDDGHRIPTDAATVKILPMRFLTLVQKGLEDHQRPPADRDSADGS
jgi:hypothetical protein